MFKPGNMSGTYLTQGGLLAAGISKMEGFGGLAGQYPRYTIPAA